jgi:Luciferase
MNPTSPARTVLDEVITWAGITTQPTARGAAAILFEGNELGHVHANRGTLDLPLPADRRAQVLEAGRAKEWVLRLGRQATREHRSCGRRIHTQRTRPQPRRAHLDGARELRRQLGHGRG